MQKLFFRLFENQDKVIALIDFGGNGVRGEKVFDNAGGAWGTPKKRCQKHHGNYQ